MQYAVLEVGLSESRVDLIDFTDLNVFRDDTMSCELRLSVGAAFVFSTLNGRRRLTTLILLQVGFRARLPRCTLRHRVKRSLVGNGLSVADVLVRVVVKVLRLLMNQREANIVLELGNREVQLEAVFQRCMLLLTFSSVVQLFEQALGERANDGLLIVVDHVLKELIDELHLEVGQVKASIVVAVELVCEVEYNFVALALL